MSPGAPPPRRWPASVLMLVDVAVLLLVIGVLAIARYDLVEAWVNRSGLMSAMALAAAVYLVTYALLVLRRCRWGTHDELVGLAVVTAFITASLATASFVTDPALIPASVALAAPSCAFSSWLAMRYLARHYHRFRRRGRTDARRTVVVGAGWGGRRAVETMLDDSSSTLVPVGLVDDDPRKGSLSLAGVRVQGRLDDLPAVCRRLDADVVLLAVPSAGPQLVQRVMDLAEICDVDVLVLPSFDEIVSVPRNGPLGDEGLPVGLDAEVPRQAFRSVRLEDLLGRGAIEIDEEGIGGYLEGKVVLVTGAGGSIGSQLCREITAFGPARLVMTDRDDSLLHGVQLSIDGLGMLDSEDLVLGDLRDRTFIRNLVARTRPDVVFHAAAVKHLTLAERFPGEAFLVNVAATSDLLQECVGHGVSHFVNISTDKAANPQSVLGYSKRLTERLTATFGSCAPDGARYISVRFGNVLGSRGSALRTFAAQLAAGRPLSITSSDMTRYFMTVHEATQLVLQAAVHGQTGEGLVLDMGEQHNIEELARRFAALNGYPDPKVIYTGPRRGEKLTERTLAAEEPDHRPFHPLVSHVPMPRLHPTVLDVIEELRDALATGTPAVRVSDLMQSLVHSPAPAGATSHVLAGGRS